MLFLCPFDGPSSRRDVTETFLVLGSTFFVKGDVLRDLVTDEKAGIELEDRTIGDGLGFNLDGGGVKLVTSRWESWPEPGDDDRGDWNCCSP